MKDKKYLVVVCGATASGKTALAIHLAQAFKTEILSSDSRQFFQEMSIGTAKPDAEELAAAKHHFVDSISIHTPYNVGDFERDSIQLLNQLYQKHDVVIMAGGSGLYIRAVCEGLDHYPDIDPSIRPKLIEEFEQKGLEHLQEQLKNLDPVYYEQVDLSNHQRLIRALEICIGTEQAFSSFQTQKKANRDFEVIKVGIHWEREQLYKRINKRVNLMVKAGLETEVRNLYEHRTRNALQTVGYKELFDHFDQITTKNEAIELIKRNSRRYAKRQLTWFRKEQDIKWFNTPLDLGLIVNYINTITTK